MQKKKGKTTIPPLLTFNLKVGFTFSVLSPSACWVCVEHCRLQRNMPKACPYVMVLSIMGVDDAENS